MCHAIENTIATVAATGGSIKAIVSGVRRWGCVWTGARDFSFQNSRKLFRCQRSRVPGWIICRTRFLLGTQRATLTATTETSVPATSTAAFLCAGGGRSIAAAEGRFRQAVQLDGAEDRPEC